MKAFFEKQLTRARARHTVFVHSEGTARSASVTFTPPPLHKNARQHRKASPRAEMAAAFSIERNKLPEGFNIGRESLATLLGHATNGARAFDRLEFENFNVAGCRQFVKLHTQVACRGPGAFAEEGEIGLLHVHQHRNHRQSEPRVKQRIEIGKCVRHQSGYCFGHGAWSLPG